MNTWFVANDNGDIIGHDLSKVHAMALALTMIYEEPDAGWEAFDAKDGE